jgi:ABC-2 type transport system permease protein
MHVYKTFFKISLRFFSSTIIYLIIYGVLAFVIPSTNKSDAGALDFEAEKISIAVIDRDETVLSQDLCEYLNEIHDVKDIGNDKEVWADELYYKTVSYILVIENGFMDNVLSGNYENSLTSYEDPASNSAFIVAGQINTYLNTLKGFISSDYELTEAINLTHDTIGIKADVKFSNATDKIVQVDSVSLYFNYLPYIVICMLINSLGPMLIVWNRPKLKARTAISGKSLSERSLSLIFAAITYSLFIFAVIIAFGIICFRNKFFSEATIYYIINAITFLIVGTTITFMVSQFCKKAEMLNMWSNIIGLGMSFLCGIFVQRSLLPDGVVNFSKCLPAYYYISVTEELRNFSGVLSTEAWHCILVQLLFAIVFLGVSMVIIKFKEKAA